MLMNEDLIFDTHCHYDDSRFDGDREKLLLSLRERGVGSVVNIAADRKGCLATMELVKKYDFMYGVLGVHPNETAELTESDMAWILRHAKEERIVAIGEIGLDFHWPEPEPEIQRKWFVRQISLAREAALPIVVHSRDAAEPTMQLIKETKAYELGGVIHCFSYSPEVALEYVKMGFYIGVGGVVTFKNGKKLRKTVENIPLSYIVLETDCPYLAPEPNRGGRNDSSQLDSVVREIAKLKGVSTQEVVRTTTENARRMYNIT